jgi:hypothetical protein
MREVTEGLAHPEESRPEDVEAIHFVVRNDDNAVLGRFDDSLKKSIALLVRELLGVVQTARIESRGQADCRHNQRPRHRPTTGLVYSRNVRREREIFHGKGKIRNDSTNLHHPALATGRLFI